MRQACKRLLANKIILAWIMKHSMEEYGECSIEDIAEKYIEGTPQVATAQVHRDEGTGELIEGMGTEDASLNEGTVTYDVRFRAVHPVSNEMVRMIINVEGQNTVNKYAIYEAHMVGAVAERKEYYDLMAVIMICLGEPDCASTELLRILDVLFSEEHSAEEKKRILVNEFDIKMTKTLEGEVEQVCDYSKGIWDKGHAQGHTQGRILGREEGRDEERARGIQLMVESCQELGASIEVAIKQLMMKYELSQKAAGDCAKQYWR